MRHGLQLSGITLLWLAGLDICSNCLSHDGCGVTWSVEISTLFRGLWQSLFTAITAGKCQPLGLCKETETIYAKDLNTEYTMKYANSFVELLICFGHILEFFVGQCFQAYFMLYDYVNIGKVTLKQQAALYKLLFHRDFCQGVQLFSMRW